jgi:hypothetical protein
VVIRDQYNQPFITGYKATSKLYVLKLVVVTTHNALTVSSNTTIESKSLETWHRCLGHINKRKIKTILKSTTGVKIKDKNNSYENDICGTCQISNQKRSKFSKLQLHQHRSRRLLELVHTDVCGPITPQTNGGNKYFVTYTDDFSRCVAVYLMKNKSEQFARFREYKQLVEN